ncbi:IclR family transcriptional regulator [Glutamicibacter endophyticus]|uniref:IclR family transcriptional regulator n=1 Tax=Glutamicibacter endophyticus TaxID=1522174 RepID=UPI003AEF616C
MNVKVPAAQHTLRILTLLASRKSPTPAAMIAKLLDIPRSSVYQILTIMVEQGYVAHYPEEQSYGLGISAFELSSAFTRQEPLARHGAPLLANLVDRIGESAHLAVLHGNDVLYIVEERAKGRPSLVTDVGVRLPSHLTASGRAILAALPKSQVRALYPRASSFTVREGATTSMRSYATLRTELEHTATRGYAQESGDVTPDFHSIAVVVKDTRDWPVAAIAVTFLAGRFTEENIRERVIEPLQETAGALADRFSGRRR